MKDKSLPEEGAANIEYRVDEVRRKRFPDPLFITVVTHRVNSEEVEKFRKRNGRLPAHVHVLKDDQHE